MKVNELIYLIKAGNFAESKLFIKILQDINDAIRKVVWPPDSNDFCLYPGKPFDKKYNMLDSRNGVKPIKDACMQYLHSRCQWQLEAPLKITSRYRPGKLDAAILISEQPELWFALEWETGNVSSSHRALNKMVLGILNGVLAGGILIVPTRKMYKHLTDRVGNLEELRPYFPVWNNHKVENGILGVIAIEHDRLSEEVERIAKGTDGWALLKKNK